MNYSDYLFKVESKFSGKKMCNINNLGVTQFYEERFEAKWLATKLKIYSFVAYQPHISKNDIMAYSDNCLLYALNDYKGLPRGFQNGVGCFNVLVSENIDADAIAYSMERPKKHFAAFEMPIIYDLSNNKLYFYPKTPMWGAIYYKFFRQYIENNFS